MPEPPERRRLTFKAAYFRVHRCRERRGGRIHAKVAKLLFEMLLCLQRYIPESPFPLQVSDELSWRYHSGRYHFPGHFPGRFPAMEESARRESDRVFIFTQAGG